MSNRNVTCSIVTDFGRMGTMFVVEFAGVVPDMMCIGKALSGGFMSFAATLTNEKVAQVFAQGPTDFLMHGPTLMGNPLASAVSLAALQLLHLYPLKSMSSPNWNRVESRHSFKMCGYLERLEL